MICSCVVLSDMKSVSHALPPMIQRCSSFGRLELGVVDELDGRSDFRCFWVLAQAVSLTFQ